MVKFEWDPEKSAANGKKHGLTFESVLKLDWIAAQTIETRYTAVAPMDGRLYAVVYCMRGVNRRVISFRRADEKEEQAYVKANETEKQAYEKVLRPPLPTLTDEEGEVRELTEDDFKGMRPLAEVDPGMVELVEAWRRELALPHVTVSIDLPEADLKHVDEFANTLGLTRSEFILRAAIREMQRSVLLEAGI